MMTSVRKNELLEEVKYLETKIKLVDVELQERQQEIEIFMVNHGMGFKLRSIKEFTNKKETYEDMLLNSKKNILHGLKAELIYLKKLVIEKKDYLRRFEN